jgi:ParB-like chromosome segregation protein Spo0J
MLPIADLKRYPENPRTHSPEQIAQINGSIGEFGWTTPILINAEGGVIGGHGRLEAAVQRGMDQVPVIRLAHLTPEQAQAYRIADNRLTELTRVGSRIAER